jgi:hypothetical protein
LLANYQPSCLTSAYATGLNSPRALSGLRIFSLESCGRGNFLPGVWAIMQPAWNGPVYCLFVGEVNKRPIVYFKSKHVIIPIVSLFFEFYNVK